MKTKKKDLRVYYGFDKKINEKLDVAVIRCVEKFGYKYWAGGSNFLNNTRDLAFEKLRGFE